jgi:hypothetical protein
MSDFFRRIKYLFLISLAIVFLYLSLSPSEYDKYLKKYNLNAPFDYVTQKYRELTFVKLSPQELQMINNKSIYINYPQKSIKYNLADLGISFNERREKIIDQKKLQEFESNLEKDLNYMSQGPIINLDEAEFYSLGEGASIKVDRDSLLGQLDFKNFLTREDLRIFPKFKESFKKENNITSNAKLKNAIASKPLQLKAGRKEINLSSSDINNLITERSVENKQILYIDKNKISEYLKNLDEKINFPTDVDFKLSADKLATHLLFRITEENSSRTFILPISGSYSFSPELHKKYIEVNKSQQRAYLFQDGRLFKTLLISTGVTWETPTGEFKVLNKVPMTISYTNNWYMPWYLPIGTINGPYYFGFHEVPYHMDYQGMIYSRDPETIGSPATGGCIQVLKGQAKELFDWAEVGIPVYITE